MTASTPQTANGDPIRVLCVAQALDRPTTELLVGLHESGIDLDVITGTTCGFVDRLREARVPVSTLNIRRRIDFPAIRELRGRLEAKRYHVYHAFNNAALSCGLLASRGKSVKIVCFRGYMGNVRIWYPPSWLTYLNPRIDRIVCVSDAVRQFFLGLRVRIPPKRVVTIYKGHELSWYSGKPMDLTSLGVPADAFTVTYVGRNHRRKGIHVLVDSAAYLPPELPIHYVLVGRLEQNPVLTRQLEASPAKHRIHRVGFRADAPQISGASDVFALPSTDREGFPRAVVEAMAHGTPPIVSNVGGMPELVEHGVSGLVVPASDPKALANAIVDLFRHPAKRIEMGRQARQRIHEVFNCRRSVRETIEMYEDLMV